MGLGAIIGAVGSIAGGVLGSGILGGGSGGSSGNAAAYAKALKDAAGQYIGPFTGQSFWDVNVPGMATQSIGYGIAQAPTINAANMTQLQSLLNQAFPGYQSMFGQATSNAQQLMQGNIPTDVSDMLKRNAAQTAVSGGYGAPMMGSNMLRNLGLTSLQMQQQGTSQFGNLMTMASNYMMPQPVNPLSLLPLSDLINTTEWSKASRFQANQAMYTAMANAAAGQYGAPTTNQGAGTAASLGGGISSLLSGLFGGSGGGGGIMSMFGGSGGGASVPAVGGGFTSPLFPSDTTSSLSYGF